MSSGGFRPVEPFPFTEAEWAAVTAEVQPVVDASFMDDDVLGASALIGLFDVLADLRDRYGDHPVLLETEADFRDDDAGRIALYRRAVRVALAHGLATLSIRLSLAEVLLDTGRPADARAELLACAGEVAHGDESERASWAELMAESGRG